LKLLYDDLLSNFAFKLCFQTLLLNFAFKFNLRRYILGARYSDRLGRKAGTDERFSPRHWMPCNSRNDDSDALMDSARHVTGCHINQEMRVSNAFDDVAGHLSWSLPRHLVPYMSRNEDL
jgi:hypothetical protein